MGLSFFGNKKTHLNTGSLAEKKPVQLRVCVSEFEDNCINNSGKILAQYLAQNKNFSVVYFDEPFSKNFLNLNDRNFFDWLDQGKNILKKTKSDVLVWGVREGVKLRLNFQTLQQYEKLAPVSFSLLENFYLPLEYVQEQRIPQSLLNLIAGAVISAADDKKGFAKQLCLEDIVATISRGGVPKGLSIDYMPQFLNMFALLSLSIVDENLHTQNVKTITRLLSQALKSGETGKNSLFRGSVCANFGQLYQCAVEKSRENKFLSCRKAIESYRIARNCFNRYVYPYDFGILSYRLSKMYFEYWKQASDIQGLRDAVFHLREAEKIFSKISHPSLWGIIQGDLGFYLSMMGMFSRNEEILMLAIKNYLGRETVFTREHRPLDWAKSQESIGNIYYNCGKMHSDGKYMEEAVKYYRSAAEVYENSKRSFEHKQMMVCIAKADEYASAMQRK